MNLGELQSDLKKKHGAKFVTCAEDINAIERLPTGIYQFDHATGGGFPRGKLSLLFGEESTGKCHAKGSKILKHNGDWVTVEDIVEGDTLMGVDSKPRIVSGTGRGHGTMFGVTPFNGGDYQIVNSEHILSLVCTSDRYAGRGSIVNISVKDYLKKNNTWKVYHHMYRVGVDYPHKELAIDPYWLGLWLGDGSSSSPAIYTIDMEIIDYLQTYADTLGLNLSVYDSERCGGYAIVGDRKRSANDNYVPLDFLKGFNLINNKHIPKKYKINSRMSRLRLLAGLIDSDGSLSSSSNLTFYNSNNRLIHEVKDLVRSLGLYASVSDKITTCNGKQFLSHCLYISGDMSDLPLLLERKKPSKRLRSGSPLTSRFSIQELPKDDFYGFELDGDHLYISDGYIVNHNTNLLLKAITMNQFLEPDKKNVFIDIEHSFDKVWAAHNGIDVDKLVIFKPDYGEQATDIIQAVLQADDVGVVGIDSIAALVPTNEQESTAEKAQVGGNALLISKLMKKCVLELSKAQRRDSYPTIIAINQRRTKIGVMFGNPESQPGGHALRHVSGLTIRMSGKDIMDTTISKNRPAYKFMKGILKKVKIPTLSKEFEFEFPVLNKGGLKIGQVKTWKAMQVHLKDLGWLYKDGKVVYCLDKEFKTFKDVQLYFMKNKEALIALQGQIIKQHMAENYDGLEEEDD